MDVSVPRAIVDVAAPDNFVGSSRQVYSRLAVLSRDFTMQANAFHAPGSCVDSDCEVDGRFVSRSRVFLNTR